MSTVSSIPLRANRMDPGFEAFCPASWACQVSAVISEIWLLFAVGLAVGLMVAAFVYLRQARSSLSEEQSRTAAERKAFREFADRIAELPTNAHPVSGGLANGGVSAVAASQWSSRTLSTVRATYRDTVMAVSHFQDEYDETMAENMAIEFGEDVAESVMNGQELSPFLQQALVSKASQSAAERGSLMGALRREEGSLLQAKETFDEIQTALSKFNPYYLREASHGTLENRWEELNKLERRCETALEARQHHLRDEPLEKYASKDRPSLPEYLYQPLEVDYPVLATGASLLEQIRTSRRTITNIVSTRS